MNEPLPAEFQVIQDKPCWLCAKCGLLLMTQIRKTINEGLKSTIAVETLHVGPDWVWSKAQQCYVKPRFPKKETRKALRRSMAAATSVCEFDRPDVISITDLPKTFHCPCCDAYSKIERKRVTNPA